MKKKSTNGNYNIELFAACSATKYPMQIIAERGYTNAKYTGSSPVKKIVLSENYKLTGFGVSISVPAGVSISGSSGDWTWTSSSYDNTTYAKALRPKIEFGCQSISKLTIGSRADFYIGNSSYPVTASDSCYYNDWVITY